MAKPGLTDLDTLQRAIALHQIGDLGGASELYRRVLEANARDFNALRLLGALKLQQGNLDEAEALLTRSVKANSNSADAHYFLGRLFWEKKNKQPALSNLHKCIALDANHENALVMLGCIASESNDSDNAISYFKRALAINPRSAGTWYNFGKALQDLTSLGEALECYDKAINLAPAYFDALLNRGVVLNALNRYPEALASYDRAIAGKPDDASAYNNRGVTLQGLGRHEDALASFDKAIALKPDDAGTWSNRGIALRALKRHEEALECYDKALAINPRHAETLYNRGAVMADLNRVHDAVASYEKTLAVQPDHAQARMGVCVAQLPILYMEESEIVLRRAAYEKSLIALRDDIDARRIAGDLAKGIGLNQPFYLTYQGRNDRELQALYGSIVCRIMADRYPPAPFAPPPAPGDPVRVGIVSGYFREHSVWKAPIRGWVTQLDHTRFQLFGYHTSGIRDDQTEVAMAGCHRFVQGPLPIDQWRELILADAPHVLVYGEVGMDHVSVKLAAQRLAPVQCNTWGHPDTSGFPTLDYYLSSDLMEPVEAQDQYSEKLIRLPNLSIYYEPTSNDVIPVSRDELGLRSGAVIYWSGQSLYKFLPQYDHVFPRIAREVNDCQFIFIQHHGAASISELFRERLNRAFAAFGLNASDYCVLLPQLKLPKFIAAMGQADIFLDSIGWSGCNTALESLPHQLPIVTVAGDLMRGRHCTAFLQRMNVTDTITDTIDDYVATAVRLGRHVPWRMKIKAKMAANYHRIYRDRECITALEEFLDRVTRNPAS